MLERARQLLRDTRGAHYAEYLVIIVVLVLLGIGAFQYFGTQVDEKVRDSADKIPAPDDVVGGGGGGGGP